jgi:bifunctional non-homologous end joining protein LigD
MSLTKYKEKRSFDKTPEPTGGKPTGSPLKFVVQKHHASHLHYDFRLEMRGVLKSWAVPKGPSMNPDDKRLAMMVEDHPWDYRDFEGIIPEGYGAGTVIVWDEGTYEPVEKQADKKVSEKYLLNQLFKGQISFILKGKKLKGEFTLVKSTGRGENAWLLIKKKDRYALKTDITKKDKSVKSGKNLEQVKETSSTIWQSHRPPKAKSKNSKIKTSKETIDINALIKSGKKSAMPTHVKPMLCTLVKEPANEPGYIYEVKWDGYRLISYVNKSKVSIKSRSGLDYTQKYPPLVKALKELKINVVLDGEAIVMNEQSVPDFNALQNFNGHDTAIYYYVFDLLWVNGYNIMQLPLLERKTILKAILKDNDVIRYSDDFEDGAALFKQMEKMDMEGIVAKKADSPYREDERSNNWLKMPTIKRQEFVIGGWAESDRARSFKSLLFGAYNKKGEFEWIGRSGGGYKEKEMPGILSKLKKLEIKSSPFVNNVLDTKGAVVHYVKPQLVANFSFATWTNTGRIRKPATFLGFRNDKKAKEVVREIAKDVQVLENEIGKDVSKVKSKESKIKNTVGGTGEDSNWKKIDAVKITSSDVFNIEECEIEITNVEREIWKGINKAELIQYYHNISKYILPYIKNRPQSLHIKPLNAYSEGFYIKDMEGRQPDCADIYTDIRKHKKAGKRDVIEYLVCNNEATLLYMINLGCVDVNPWTSTIDNPTEPGYIVIDLDPSDDDFKKVIETAKAAKELFESKRLKSLVKTSGKSGMHILLPCSGFDFTAARTIAQKVCDEINKLVPSFTTTEISVSQRGKKLYIDPNQNDYADTIAAPYCARPNKVPTVSTPIDWKEIKDSLYPSDFTIKNILERVKKKGDLFKGLFDKKAITGNNKILKQLL